MKLYDCRVRINGSLNHVTIRNGVTAAEIALLRWLHSRSENANEPVIDIVEVGEVARRDAAERKRLAENYSLGELTGERLVNQVFGVPGVALPQSVELVEEADEVEAADEEEATLPAAPPVQIPATKRGRPSKAELEARAKAELETAA